MSIKSRLSHLQVEAGSGSALSSPASSSSLSQLRMQLAQLDSMRQPQRQSSMGAQRTSDEQLASTLQGSLIDEGVILIQREVPFSAVGKIDPQQLHHKPHLPDEPDSENLRCIYIDTETTGLSGGSGTLAFLVGIAFVDGNVIQTRQYLLTRFAAETKLLSTFAKTVSAEDQLVSYNGKSYDLPLLISRFRMQSMAHPFAEMAHLDLLHPVRRLFRQQWDNCRLTTLEKNLLGFKRIDDLPGSEAPSAWFSYVRDHFGTQLVKVVEHNWQDIVSLVVAHRVLSRAIEEPEAHGVDHYALARWLSESDEKAAMRLLKSNSKDLCDDGKRLLGHLCKRAGDWRQAVQLWESLVARGCTDSMERLAKYHEHISKDLALAHSYCMMLPANAAQKHRYQRIRQKLQHTQAIPGI